MKVQDIKKGFKTPWYEVIEDALIYTHEVVLIVRYADGGRALRTFNIDTELAGTPGAEQFDELIRGSTALDEGSGKGFVPPD